MAFLLQMIWQCFGYTEINELVEKSGQDESRVRLNQFRTGE